MKKILITVLLLTGCTTAKEDLPSFKVDTLCNFEGVLRCDANDGECWCVERKEEVKWYVSLGLIGGKQGHQK